MADPSPYYYRRYEAESPKEAAEQLAAAWRVKTKDMSISKQVTGSICAIPGCDWRSVCEIETTEGHWLLCLSHFQALRDLS